MFSTVLVANRGEIAVRIARTCRDLGIRVVAVYSALDEGARHAAMADEAVPLPGMTPAETYLNVGAILDAARATGAQAIHPGYGFLSERAEFAEAVEGAGLVWIGPPAEATRAAGDKLRARRLAEGAGVPPVPGTLDPISSADEIVAFGRTHGYPLAIKAAGGGGGRGLRVAGSGAEVQQAFEAAAREAEVYFGTGDVYVERYLPAPKHLEVQVLSETPGEAMWLGVRDCSLQRRHQKIIEETPPPRLEDLVPKIGEAGVAVANACGYVNAGTIEFLVDPGEGRFYFLEINARLQVEHTITEEVLGVDLVAAQLRIAAGEPVGFGQEDVLPGGRLEPRGHALECRINAEDPGRAFLPAPGTITGYHEPGGPGVRVDSGFEKGSEISGAYDSLIAKLIVRGADREEARRRMLRALREFTIEGIRTTIPAHRVLLESESFTSGTYTTRTIEEGDLLHSLVEEARARPATAAASPGPVPADAASIVVRGVPARLWHPAVAPSAPGSRAAGGAGAGQVVAPMHGTILRLLVSVGDQVNAGDPVAILEAMKMETHIPSPAGGRVAEVSVEVGAVVESGQPIVRIEGR